MQKNLALITKYFKKIHNPTNNNLRTSSNSKNKNVDTTPRYKNDDHSGQFGTQRTINVDAAREKVGKRRKGLRTPRTTRRRCCCASKLSKQAEQGVPLQAEQYDWLADTDEEVDEQELEAHYSYMAKIQEVPAADSGTYSEPDDIHNEQNDVESDDERVALANLKLNVDENKKIQKQLKKVNTTLAQELKECKAILAETSKSLGESISVRDSCLVALQTKQAEFKKYKAFNDHTVDYDKLERKLNEALGQSAHKDTVIREGLKTRAYELSVIKEKHDKLMKQSLLTKSHYEGLVKQKTKEYETQLAHANEIRRKMWRKSFVKSKPNIYKNVGFLPISKSISKSQQAYNVMTNNINHFKQIVDDAWIKHSKDQFRAPTAQDMEILIQTCLMPLAIKTHNDSFKFVHELKQEMHAYLKYVECLEKEIDELESDKAEFSNMYGEILKECVSKDVMCFYLQSLSDLDALAELQCMYLHNVKECDCLAQKLSKQSESISKKVHTELLQRFAKVEKHSISLELALQKCKEQTKSVPKANVSEGLSKPVSAQTLPQTSKKAIVQLILFIVDSGFCANYWLWRFGSRKCHDQQGLLRRMPQAHNLFSIGQFCDADLEVAFRKSTCFVRDLQGNDLLVGNYESDLYTIFLQESTSSTPLYLMAKATPTQAWLWHQRLSHLNFDYINLLSKKDIVIGLPKLKYVKDQLCSSCELSKAKRSSFKSKAISSSKGRLNLLHMDLCGPTRVASINGKKYILVIVDDYSRYTGTEFLNKTLNAFFKEEGIKHQTSTARTPEQNDVVERWNRTLVEAPRTMLSASQLPLFFWAESKGYRVYNKRTRIIVESIHIRFDKIKEVSETQDVYSSAYADVPSQQELDLLFGPLYDEFFNAGSNPLTNIQSTSAPSTHTNVHAEENNNDQAEEVEQLQDDEFTNPFCASEQDVAESSSHNIGNLNVPTFNQPQVFEYRWTKDHPLEQVRGNPSRPVQTRRQLATDPEMCMYALTVSTAELKNIKEAMADSAWIEAMQEELHQFDRLQVWELVDKPFGKTVIKLKWLWKNKKDKDQTVIRNKARLVAKGYA
nr:Gag-Pol polyprotein [Tanacetum cinerariifolium]